MVVLWRTACGGAFALVVFTACCLDTAWFRMISTPLRYLGTISFGIYLWHLPVLLSVKRMDWVQPEQALWLVLGGTLVLAAGSWHLLEHPILKRYTLGTNPESGRGPGHALRHGQQEKAGHSA